MQLYQKNFEENSIISITSHILIIILLFVIHNHNQKQLLFSIPSISIIVIILAIRLFSIIYDKKLIAYIGILATALWWSSIFFIEIQNIKQLSPFLIFLLMVILGLTSGGSYSFIKRTDLLLSYVAIMILPTALSFYLYLSENNIAFAILILIYSAFIIAYALKQNKMWLELIKSRLELEVKTFNLKKKKEELKKNNYILDQALLKAEAASKTKSLFLANMSHEIRTPLNGIVGATEILKNTELDEKQKKFVNILEYSGTNLLNIINDILDFSKISERKIKLLETSINLKEVIYDIIDQQKNVYERKEIDIITKIDNKIPDEIIVDELRLKQILNNIISNAIKFTTKGHVFVNVSVQQEKEETQIIHFSIEDTGIGIPKDKIDTIFESFTQAYGELDRKYGGTGLGVTISKLLVELMGGTIKIISPNPNNNDNNNKEFPGTIVSFDIPIKKEKEYKKTNKKTTFPKINALIIDDNETNLMVFSELLNNIGIKNTTIKNHSELIQIFDKNKISDFDLILIDYKMPDFNGIEVLRKIKSETKNKKQKYILLSSASLSFKEEILKEGFDYILIKPIKEKVLISILINLYTKTQKTHIPKTKIKHKIIPDLKILVVEDNIINQKVFASILKQIGYNCEIANNGNEALEKLKDKSINLVFMDIQMPVKNGYETVSEMRNNKDHRIVIAVTANTMENDEIKCFAAGINDYIPKPVNKNQIINILNKWGEKAVH